MSFFERYFAALDGPDPHSSLELVADDVEFSIQWARGSDRDSRQLVGGRAELRAFIDAGDMGAPRARQRRRWRRRVRAR